MTFYLLLLFMKCWFIVRPFKGDIGTRDIGEYAIVYSLLSDNREWEKERYVILR